YQVEIPLRTVFDRPTPARLLEAIRQTGETPAPPLRKSGQKEAPLSFAQSRLWFLDQFREGSTTYNVPAALRLRGDLNSTALEQSLETLIRRHGSLRTLFREAPSGEAFQHIIDLDDFTLPVESIAEGDLEEILKREAHHLFDLREGPLYRFRLWRIGERDHLLTLNIHHIVFDGWSFGIFLRELAACYAAFRQDQTPLLPDPAADYSDYAQWQRRWLAGDLLDSQSAYWKDRLEGMPELLTLPTDRPRPDIQSLRGGHIPVELDPAAVAALRQICRENNVTLFMALETLWAIFLAKYSGMDDIVVGTPLSGRTRPEIENTIGFFVNTLPLRHNLSGHPTFRELLGQTRQIALETYAHQDIPFEKLVEELAPERNTDRSPIFQVLFALADETFDLFDLEDLEAETLFPEFDSAKFDLTLNLGDYDGRICGHLEYSSDLFDASTAARMARHFHNLVGQAALNPGQPVTGIPLLDPQEYDLVVCRFNDSAVPFPADRILHQLFEEQVERTPDQIAVQDGREELTYSQLNRRANRIAYALIAMGVRPDTLVGLCLERGVNLVASILGIHKAGGAYLPLDPLYPTERLAFMIQDAGLRIMVTDSDLEIPFRGERLLIDDPKELTGFPVVNPGPVAAPDNLAYVIYTSGSTGQPKGVLVEHRGLVNLALAQSEMFGVTPHSRVLQFASPSFDASISEIAMALVRGAALCVPRSDTLLAGEELAQILIENRIDVATLPPTALASLDKEIRWLKNLIVAGESCPPELVGKWSQGRNFFNAYGPTECTVCATMSRYREGQLTIGRPMANTQIHILDAHGLPQPPGVPGELCVGGVGVARGYLNRNRLTKEKFIPNPFGPGRLYRTGDSARWLESGEIEYLGRIDQQVKIRGFRIELGEVESALREHAFVYGAVVNPFGKEGEKRLCAYVVGDFETAELRDYVGRKLPHYMIPSVFMKVETFPLTPSGKIDRKKLPHPEIASDKAYTPPRNDTEKVLCAVFAEVLGLEQVGIHDNFFELGGNSLLLVRTRSLANKRLASQLNITDFFHYPTIARLAELLGGVAPSPQKRELPAVQVAAEDAVAIIGMAGHFPGALTVEEYWDNLI
ncbi:MAG: amino acid adenylation domain-containing protein, partial [Desulfuromonadaceae bacterium]|nr:amino acid adenylation domain-containing protein [Desulfuromonadaceae bacterium]